MNLNIRRIASHINPNIGVAIGIRIVFYLESNRQIFILFRVVAITRHFNV